MVLQGFFDDSGSSPNQPVFVLAGFLSTTDRWAQFSNEWAAKLTSVGLPSFKMSSGYGPAWALREGWSHEARDKFVYELAEIIGRHGTHRVDVSVFRTDFDDLLLNAVDSPEYADPYYLLFQTTCRAVWAGISDPCDFIFDEQGKVGLRAVSWWPHVRDWFDPKVHPLIGSSPIFRDDARFRPLQAADMYAWLIRERLTYGTAGRWQAKAYLKAMMHVPHRASDTREATCPACAQG